MLYSLYSIVIHQNQYRQSAEKLDGLRKIYQESSLNPGQLESEKQHDQKLKNHEELQDLNEDYVGWIDVLGTTISYPIVMGEDNEYYLKHNYYRERDFVGSIFMDYRNSRDKLDKNTIIYGHNMKDDSMFGSLEDLLDQEFFEKHQTITLNYPDGQTYKWELFSAYATTDVEWMRTDFSKQADFARYLRSVKNKSVILSETEVGEEVTILTLSTCTDRDNDERIVVHAKLIRGKS